jgi:beta-lactamase superfamily II metal-dependent hydrolase
LPGDSDRLGTDAAVRILYPPSGAGSRTADDQTLVARIEVNGFRILLMSDAGAATEDALVRLYGKDLRSNIVIFGRHGEDITATEAFLRATQPDVIVLNRADPFRDGSDEPALHSRLAASKAKVFDQEKCGAVILTATSRGLEIRGFLDKSTAELSAR